MRDRRASEGRATITIGTLPGEDTHARMIVQGYLVAPWQAEDAQRECRLLMYVHVGHGGSPPTASAPSHSLDSEATCQVKSLHYVEAELPKHATCGRCSREDGASQRWHPWM